MAEMAQIESTAFSRKVRRLFGLDLHSWEQVMLVSLGFAALAAVAVVVATTSVVKLQKKEADDAEKALNAYKLTVEEKVADAKKEGIKAGETAGNALVRAAELEKEASLAKLETEKIKLVVAWRTISPETALELEKILAANPGSVNLRYMDGDPESWFLYLKK
jgi:hypothetical protein